MKKIKQALKKSLTSTRNIRTLSIFLGLVSVYCVIVVLYNIFEYKFFGFTLLENVKVLGEPVMIGMGAGTLISWISFLIMDVITEVWGKKTAIKIFTFAMIISITTSFFGMAIAKIGEPSYGEAIENIFGSHPRVTIASAFAFWVGSYINTLIMHVMKTRAEDKGKAKNKKLFAFRATTSTLLGQAVDNALFQIIGLAPFGVGFWLASPFGWTWGMVIGSIIVGTILELAIEAALVPFITIPLANKLIAKKEAEEAELVAAQI